MLILSYLGEALEISLLKVSKDEARILSLLNIQSSTSKPDVSPVNFTVLPSPLESEEESVKLTTKPRALSVT